MNPELERSEVSVSTMPFNTLQRRDSWPPTVVHLRRDEPEDLDAIDEDPFSYFLTAPEEIDFEDDFDEDLSAGIESSSKSPHVREISPSKIQDSPPLPLMDDDDSEDDFGVTMPLSLKDFARRLTNNGRTSRATERSGESARGLGIQMPESSVTRGRTQVRPVPSRNMRGRGQTRSLSLRRPHSWTLPSPDLGSIMEERECDDGEDAKNGSAAREQSFSTSAPVTSSMRQIEQTQSPKPKKRVHWAV